MSSLIRFSMWNTYVDFAAYIIHIVDCCYSESIQTNFDISAKFAILYGQTNIHLLAISNKIQLILLNV